MTIKDIIEGILRREAWPLYTNHGNDRGGPTKGGITQKTLSAWRGHPVTPEDVEELSRVEALTIYHDEYVMQPHFDKIKNDFLREHVVDAGVLHGSPTVTCWLQAIADVVVDDCFGPISQSALNAMSPRDVNTKFAALRIRYIGKIISNNFRARKNKLTTKDQSEWAGGWLNRATSFLDELGSF